MDFSIVCTLLQLFAAVYAHDCSCLQHCMHTAAAVCSSVCTLLQLFAAVYAHCCSCLQQCMHATAAVCSSVCTLLQLFAAVYARYCCCCPILPIYGPSTPDKIATEAPVAKFYMEIELECFRLTFSTKFMSRSKIAFTNTKYFAYHVQASK